MLSLKTADKNDTLMRLPISRRVYIMGEIAKPHEGFFPTKEDERLSDILQT